MVHLHPMGGPVADREADGVEVMLLPGTATTQPETDRPVLAQSNSRVAQARTESVRSRLPEQEANPDTFHERDVALKQNTIYNDNLHKNLDVSSQLSPGNKSDHALAAAEHTATQVAVLHKLAEASAAQAQARAEAERKRAVRERLERFKHYPASARRRGIEGAVDVSFRLNAEGRAEDMQLVSGSGYTILDDAALSTVRRAEPFPVQGGTYRFRLLFTRS